MSKKFSTGELSDHAEAMADKLPENIYRQVMDKAECGILTSVMRRTRGNQSKAAMMLGINRATLRVKLKRHGFI